MDQPENADEQHANQDGDQGKLGLESTPSGVDAERQLESGPDDDGRGEGNEDNAGTGAGNEPSGSMVGSSERVSDSTVDERTGTAAPNLALFGIGCMITKLSLSISQSMADSTSAKARDGRSMLW